MCSQAVKNGWTRAERDVGHQHALAAVARVTGGPMGACRTVRGEFGLSLDEIGIDHTFANLLPRNLEKRSCLTTLPTDDVVSQPPDCSRFGIVSYASIPFSTQRWTFFGTLCATTNRTRDVEDPRVVAMLERFARHHRPRVSETENVLAQKNNSWSSTSRQMAPKARRILSRSDIPAQFSRSDEPGVRSADATLSDKRRRKKMSA